VQGESRKVAVISVATSIWGDEEDPISVESLSSSYESKQIGHGGDFAFVDQNGVKPWERLLQPANTEVGREDGVLDIEVWTEMSSVWLFGWSSRAGTLVPSVDPGP
jgi:hypothetical protein